MFTLREAYKTRNYRDNRIKIKRIFLGEMDSNRQNIGDLELYKRIAEGLKILMSIFVIGHKKGIFLSQKKFPILKNIKTEVYSIV